MEFPFNVDAVISERITRLDAGSLGRIASRLSSGFSSPKTLQQLEVIVDKMGVASAKVPNYTYTYYRWYGVAVIIRRRKLVVSFKNRHSMPEST